LSEKDENLVISIRRRFLETPKGRIPTYDFTLDILEAVKALANVATELGERVDELGKGGGSGLDELKNRLEKVEEVLEGLEKKLELDLEDINDKLSTLMEAFDKLVERIQRLEESSSKG